MPISTPALFGALREIILVGDVAELPLDDTYDYLGPPMGEPRNSSIVDDETQTREQVARLLRYVAEFAPLPKNLGCVENVAVVNQWIEENRPCAAPEPA